MLGEAIFERKDDPLGVQGYHVGGFSYIRQLLDMLHNFILYFLQSSQRDAGSISIINIPLGKSFSKLGWLPLKLGWPPGRPSIPFGPPGNLVFRLGLNRPLGRNGVI
jgi:hypothetical protein